MENLKMITDEQKRKIINLEQVASSSPELVAGEQRSKLKSTDRVTIKFQTPKSPQRKEGKRVKRNISWKKVGKAIRIVCIILFALTLIAQLIFGNVPALSSFLEFFKTVI